MGKIIIDLEDWTAMVGSEIVLLDDVELIGTDVGWAGLRAIAQNAPDLVELLRSFGERVVGTRKRPPRGTQPALPLGESSICAALAPATLDPALVATAEKIIVVEFLRSPWSGYDVAEDAATSGAFDVVSRCMVKFEDGKARTPKDRANYVAMAAYNWCKMERRKELPGQRHLCSLTGMEDVL